jgi:predicted small lipoprotein YifL
LEETTLKNIRISILLALLLFALAACGGGGGSTPAPPAKTATLKLFTTGTPSENLAGVGITITLPTGVTPALNSDGTVAATVVTVSGVASPGTVVSPVYTPASGAVKGKLVIAVASGIVAGFGAGEYATVVLAAEAGTAPLQSDFALTDFRPIAVSNGADAAGLTATISGYTLQ